MEQTGLVFLMVPAFLGAKFCFPYAIKKPQKTNRLLGVWYYFMQSILLDHN